MEILLATLNFDKVKEIKKILEGLPMEILTLKELGDIFFVNEDGKTFEENALKKASFWAKKTGINAVADDSGLEVDYLKGAPGIYSSQFSGENATYADNNEKLLKLLGEVEEEERTARFRCVVAFVSSSGKKKIFEGKVEGIITMKPQGKKGFGYDPIFLIPEYGKTFAELGEDVKNKISHRAIAFRKLKKFLEEWSE